MRISKRNSVLIMTALILTVYMLLTVPIAATLQSLQVGMEAPDFSVKSISGEAKSFQDVSADKLTAIVFWSSWSPRSEKVLARMQTLYEKYKDQGFSVAAINVEGLDFTDETLNKIKGMAEKLKLTYPVYIDYGLDTFHEYGVIAIPTTVILDKEKMIRYELSSYPLVGSEEMVDYIMATMEGRDPSAKVAEKTGYQPDKKSLRFWNMGKNALKSKRMANTAELWFQKAIEADPKFVHPYLSLGKFYVKRDKVDMAKKQFEEAINQEPENVIALCELGMLLVNAGKIGEGKALFEKAMKLEDSYTPCYYYRGFAEGKEGKLEETEKSFQEAEAINPMDYKIYVYHAMAYEELKMQKEASEQYKKALELITKR